jgi:hypothetical protein
MEPVQFSGASSESFYTTTGGEWTEVAARAYVVPEPGTGSLVLIASLLLLLIANRSAFRSLHPGGPCRRSIIQAPYHGNIAILVGLLMATGPSAKALADGFVLTLADPPAGDTTGRPFIDLTATVGGRQVTVKALVDTGAGSSTGSQNLKFDTGAAITPALTGGTAQRFRGVGGEVAGKINSDVPAGAGLGFSVPPVAATGNTAQSPTLPNKADSLPLPRPGGATIPDNYLTANFGAVSRVEGPGGKFLALVTKAEVDTATRRNTVDIANFLAFPTPIRVNSDGRPAGTQSSPVTPIPPRTPPPNEELYNVGYRLPASVSVPGSTILHNVPFLISSGLRTTLISDSLAGSLGLNPSLLPTAQVEGNFGLFTVHLANYRSASLPIRLFPPFSCPSVSRIQPPISLEIISWARTS